ncbi:glutamate dehydrogenase [Sinorhizobium fredii]
MGVKHNPKRDRHIDAARAAVTKIGTETLPPEILFGGASNDDLDLYSPDMLALTAAHARQELARWDGGKPQVSVETVPGIAPGGTEVSIIAVTERNMPFLYDSVMGEVTSTHRDIHLAIHPILVTEPGRPAKLFDPDEQSDPAHRVSHIQIHLSKLTPLEERSLSKRITDVLEQVHQTVHDWPAMTALLDQAMQELEDYNASRKKSDRDEALAFLRWLRDNNFTFLGMREYTYSGKGEKASVERGKGRGLGILSNPDVRVLRQGKDAVLTTPEILAFLEGPDFLIVTKANVKSVVHRRAYMDYIGVKRFDASGNVVGELRIVGLFTSTAYTCQAAEIPLLRHKIEKIIDHFGYDPQSHSGKMLANTLEAYPRDDLFQIDVGVLAAFCEQINELGDRPRVRVLPRIDHFDRFVSVIVFVPREQYDSDVREKIGDYLKTVYDGRVSAYYPAFPEGGLARVHFIIGRSGGKTPRVPQAKLEEAVRSIVTRWTDRFNLFARKDGIELSVGEAYQAAFTPAEAYADLNGIAACKADDPIRISFYHRDRESPDALELKIFHADTPVSLSRRVPLLENLGFRVISEQTHDIGVRAPGQEPREVVLHDMELIHRDGHTLNLAKTGAALEEAFLAAWNGTIEDDNFNRLVLLAGLTAREVTVLRAYSRYLRQAGITYSQGYIAETLNKYPAIAADIFRLFSTRLDPKIDAKARAKKTGALLATIEEALSAVPSLDEDRILRRYVNVIQSTLRTNYFQKDAEGRPRPVLAFKLDPKQLEGLPEPRPFREIFVYGTEVEGVHLRFGKVARGGLRWSDRAQDYRTEVLGLVKAQQVKNAVIVPVGAKGGFYPKQLPVGGTRDEIFRAGTEAYKTYIRTLLSVTDNIVGQEVVPPKDTLRLDGDDPYFVVAADKGTATFSDTANGLAQEAGFWLDDAFASGGSAGYDHKKMGITARGAWEAVKRHFREMDIDIQTTPFTVAGVGDMSGDVFGNGMLLSEKIRLIAAFDHRDIVIDPNPDIDLSFVERKRMFALPRSSWQDYDRKTLSPGAMIISRAEKLVTLTPEAMAVIGIDKQKATPFEIMNAILKSQVDLLWFGGIGTYVRGSSETDADVGDRANDPIRVTAEEVRARVIGEGANLGVTQRGRIGFSLAGGRCNSDAIDNSAGVNSSDVEVNIKIALASAMRDGRLTRPKRNTLLAGDDRRSRPSRAAQQLPAIAGDLAHGNAGPRQPHAAGAADGAARSRWPIEPQGGDAADGTGDGRALPGGQAADASGDRRAALLCEAGSVRGTDPERAAGRRVFHRDARTLLPGKDAQELWRGHPRPSSAPRNHCDGARQRDDQPRWTRLRLDTHGRDRLPVRRRRQGRGAGARRFRPAAHLWRDRRSRQQDQRRRPEPALPGSRAYLYAGRRTSLAHRGLRGTRGRGGGSAARGAAEAARHDARGNFERERRGGAPKGSGLHRKRRAGKACRRDRRTVDDDPGPRDHADRHGDRRASQSHGTRLLRGDRDAPGQPAADGRRPCARHRTVRGDGADTGRCRHSHRPPRHHRRRAGRTEA